MNRLQEIGNVCGIDLSDLENIFPVPIAEICERIGLNVEFCDFPNGQAGKLIGNTIQVNDNYSGTRNLFTISHEIGHFVINKSTKLKNDKNRFDDKRQYSKEELAEERRANEFAAELLMPTEIFTNKFLEFKQGDFKYTKLSQFFKVSKEACLYRALNLGLSDNV
jgi:Zn-dependent peptidase ImmA (M78 family)